jgi:hypothetical protein
MNADRKLPACEFVIQSYSDGDVRCCRPSVVKIDGRCYCEGHRPARVAKLNELKSALRVLSDAAWSAERAVVERARAVRASRDDAGAQHLAVLALIEAVEMADALADERRAVKGQIDGMLVEVANG